MGFNHHTAAMEKVAPRSKWPARLLLWLTHALVARLLSLSASFPSPPLSTHAFSHAPLVRSSSSWPRGELLKRPTRLHSASRVSDASKLRSARDDGDRPQAPSISNGGEPDHPVLSITTFNVLAPIFKRVGSGRESEFRDTYIKRHTAILEHLKVRACDDITMT